MDHLQFALLLKTHNPRLREEEPDASALVPTSGSGGGGGEASLAPILRPGAAAESAALPHHLYTGGNNLQAFSSHQE